MFSEKITKVSDDALKQNNNDNKTFGNDAHEQALTMTQTWKEWFERNFEISDQPSRMYTAWQAAP